MRKFKAANNLSLWLVMITWGMLIIVPYFCLRVAADYFLKNQLRQNIIAIEPALYSEMTQFSQDLDEKTMLKHLLQKFDQKAGFIDHSQLVSLEEQRKFRKVPAIKLKKQLEETLGFPVLALMTYSADTQNVDAITNENLPHKIGFSSKAMLKRMFAILNRQKDCGLFFAKDYKPAFPAKTDLKDKRTRETYTTSLLQMMFGTIYDPILREREIFETAASKAGKTGNIFFYRGKAVAKDGVKLYNLGGYLAVIRLQDIPERKIFSFALKRNLDARLERRFGHVAKVLKFPDSFQNLGVNRFYWENDRYCLRTILPQIPMVRRIQKGTILPVDFTDFTGRTAVIETSIKIEKLKHPWHQHLDYFHLLLKFFLLLGTLVFIYVFIFRFNFRASISFKLSLTSFLVCIVPILSLYLVNSVYQDYSKNVFVENLKNHLQTRSVLLQRSINEEFDNYSQRTIKLARFLKDKLKMDRQSILQLLQSWSRENSANGVIFQNFDDRALAYYDTQVYNNDETMGVWKLKMIFFNSLIEFLFTSPKVTDNPDSYSAILTDGSNNSESIHEALINRGRLQSVSRLNTDSRLSGCLIQEENAGINQPTAFLAVDYSVEKILDDLFSRELSKLNFKERFSGFGVDMALFKKANGDFKVVPGCYSPDLNIDDTRQAVSRFSQTSGESFFKRSRAGRESFIFIFNSANFPYALFIEAVLIDSQQSGFFTIGLWLYPIIVIILGILLANLFFVAPGEEFSLIMNQIAEGNLEARMELKTGDEFERLGTAVNLMTKSLVEKEHLEKYVSADLINEINRHTEAEMLPGGEKVGATVVFSSFKTLQKATEELTPEEIVEQIDIFLGICNSICANNHGVIDKIIGNTMMMVFRGKFDGDSHAIRACNAAAQIHQAMLANDFFACRCFTGISSGTVVSGRIGSKTGKLDYTVIGDTVNMAARLKALAEIPGSSAIIVSQSAAERVRGRFQLTELEPVEIKGKQGKHRTWAIG